MKKNIIFILSIIFIGSCQSNGNQNHISFSEMFGGNCSTITITGDPESPPITWKEEGKILTGAGINLFSRIANNLGIKARAIYTKNRNSALNEVKESDIDIMVGAKPYEINNKLIQLRPEIIADPVIIILRSYDDTYIRGLETLVGKKGIALEKMTYGHEVDKFINSSLDVKLAKNYDELFKELIHGQAEYIISHRNIAWAEAKRLNVRHKIKPSSTILVDTKLYAVMGAKSACRKYIPEIESQLKNMQENGEIMSLFLDAGNRWDNKYQIKKLK